MLYKVKYIIVLFFFFPLFLFPQHNNKISDKNKELNRLKDEIAQLEKKIQTYSKKEKITAKELDQIEKQIFLYDKLISDLRREINLTEKSLQEIDGKLSRNKQKIAEVKKIFEKYAIWLYKMREPTIWDYFFDSKNFNENLEMKYYFEFFEKEAEAKIDSLNEYEKNLVSLKNEKLKKKKYLSRLIREKQKNKEKALASKRRKNKTLAKLRKDKNNFARIVKEKRNREKQISALIARLIKEEEEAEAKRLREIAARKKEKSAATENDFFNYASGVRFAKLKGKLPWPVYGKIAKRYGKVRNKKLKTVSINNGIDIMTEKNAKVKAVADGVVSAVEWLPGYGPVVILSHGSKYKTVYGFVDDFKVAKGDKVKAGAELGKVASSVYGNILHFEVWNKREAENPEKWLLKN